MRLGREQGGIQRGDRADTGDLEARPRGERPGNTEDLGDLTVHESTDPELGLTATEEVPAQDWAADTGPTRSGEASSQGVDRRLAKQNRGPGGHKIDFDHGQDG